MNYKPEESELAKLAVQLSDYTELINTKGSEWINIETEIDRYLIEANIPFPKFDIHHIDKGYIRDSTYYSNAEFANALNLLKNENFRTRLKSHRTILSIDYLDFKTLEEESIAILNRIKRSVPNVKLLYEDVGIIGTSINGYDDVGANSTPMILKDENKSIWEIDIFLKEGSVKFRCRDSWAINWGGLTFPEGTPLPDGPDIPVEEAGNYKVILDITGGKYEFIKLEE